MALIPGLLPRKNLVYKFLTLYRMGISFYFQIGFSLSISLSLSLSRSLSLILSLPLTYSFLSLSLNSFVHSLIVRGRRLVCFPTIALLIHIVGSLTRLSRGGRRQRFLSPNTHCTLSLPEFIKKYMGEELSQYFLKNFCPYLCKLDVSRTARLGYFLETDLFIRNAGIDILNVETK